jgi:hypothetical protein
VASTPHVHGVDPTWNNANDDTFVARMIVRTQISPVLFSNPFRERAVVVRRHFGVPTQFQVALWNGEIENEEAALRTRY